MKTDFLVSMGCAKYVPASAVKVGDHVVEADGAFFEVSSVEAVARGRVRFGFRNINGYMVAPREATVRAKAQVRVRA